MVSLDLQDLAHREIGVFSLEKLHGFMQVAGKKSHYESRGVRGTPNSIREVTDPRSPRRECPEEKRGVESQY